MIDYKRHTWFLSDVLSSFKPNASYDCHILTAETYESGRMERFNRLKTVSAQKFRRNALDYMMINKTTYLNIL